MPLSLPVKIKMSSDEAVAPKLSKIKKKTSRTNNLINLGAINKKTKTYETPLFADKKNKYYCPDCCQDVILKQGEIRRYHFAHKAEISDKQTNPDGGCNYYNHPGESQIHKHAKELLKVALERKKCKISRACMACGEELVFDLPKPKKTDEVRVECAFEWSEGARKVADVAIVDKDEFMMFIFEVCNTHKTKEEDRPEDVPWYELDALSLIEAIEESGENVFNVKCIRKKVCDLCEKFRELDGKEVGVVLWRRKRRGFGVVY